MSDFYSDKTKKDGVRAYCKVCWAGMSKRYQTANREKIEEKHKIWRSENKHIARMASKNFRLKNPSKIIASNCKRKADERRAVPPWFEKDLVDIVYAKAKEFGFQVDHIIPLAGKLACGLHCWHNLQLLDKQLNFEKRNKLLAENL